MKIGIVGFGFVGRATAMLFADDKVYVYDKDPYRTRRVPRCERVVDDIAGLSECEIIFVCVPTPMKKNGQCDVSIVESVVKDLCNFTLNPVIAIRSTVPPGFTAAMNDWDYRNDTGDFRRLDRIMFVPEFLTERNWEDDVRNADRVVVGGEEPFASFVAWSIYAAYKKFELPMPKFIRASSTAAELGKLAANGLLATKVAFCNEVYALAQRAGADYAQVREVVSTDPRIGWSHSQVPGPDGQLGFGGTCFPKDLYNLRAALIEAELPYNLIDTILQRNETLRPKSQLEKGRAITED